MALPTLTSQQPPSSSTKRAPPSVPPSSGSSSSAFETTRRAPLPSSSLSTSSSSSIVSISDDSFYSALFNPPITFSFESEIKKAIRSCHSMKNSMEWATVRQMVKNCDGIAFLTVLRGGVFLTGQIGQGLILLKDSNGNWSAPAAVGGLGGGFGLQGGLDTTDYVLFFKTPEGQEAMKGNYQLALGVSGGVSAGPFGRTGALQYHWRLDAWKMACAWALSWSKGWYAGGALTLQLLCGMSGLNEKMYGGREGGRVGGREGGKVGLAEILGGKFERPHAAKELYECLEGL